MIVVTTGSETVPDHGYGDEYVVHLTAGIVVQVGLDLLGLIVVSFLSVYEAAVAVVDVLVLTDVIVPMVNFHRTVKLLLRTVVQAA